MSGRVLVVLCSLIVLGSGQRFGRPPPPPAAELETTPEMALEPPAPPPSAPELEPTIAPTPPLVKSKSSVCEQKNARYSVPGQCDAYVECKNFVPYDMMCPDGLYFNPEAAPNVYPCGYPLDVPCKERSGLQAAQPTDECPHRYGYFKSEDPLACGSYRACVDGHVFRMQCAAGLAWNQDAYKCDWPDQVPECDVDAFIGFKCPPVTLDQNGEPAVVDRFFSHSTSCYMYYDCLNEKPRLLSCDAGLAFDPQLSRCVDSELMPSCHRR